MELDRNIDITAKQRKTVLALLERHLPNTAAWVYGSRAKWTSRPQSDLDMVVFATPEQASRVSDLREAFEESNLPFGVDLFVWDTVPEQFRKQIKRDHVVLVEGGNSNSGGRNWLYHPEFPEHWDRKPLHAMARWVNGLAFRDFQFSSTGKPVIKIAEIKGGISGQSKFTHQTFDESVRVRSGDLLFSWSGQPETSIDAFWWRGPEGWLNQHVFRVTPINSVDDTFFFYLLRYLKPNFVGIARNKQTTGLGHVTKRDLENIEVATPPLSEQRAIAHILSTLDDKIELNRRMNETLEAMARALFKSWFVDFDPVRSKMEGRDPGLPKHIADFFPDRLVDSELGEIPVGWEVKRIDAIAERVAMGPFGSSIRVSTFVEEGIPVISGRHLNGTLLEDNEYRFISKEHAEKLARANVRRGDVVFTHAGSIGQVAYIPRTSQFERYIISQRQFYMRCDLSQISPLFVVHFFKTKEGQHQLLSNTSSTGVPSISRPVTNLRSIRLCIPPSVLWHQFDAFVDALHLKVGRNIAEYNVLAAQRDTLLPKLISGELCRKQMEIKTP